MVDDFLDSFVDQIEKPLGLDVALGRCKFRILYNGDPSDSDLPMVVGFSQSLCVCPQLFSVKHLDQFKKTWTKYLKHYSAKLSEAGDTAVATPLLLYNKKIGGACLLLHNFI